MPAAAEEVVGDDPRQNLVQSVGQRVAHGATWMQRRTYCFVVVLQVVEHLGGDVDRLQLQGARVLDVSRLGEHLEHRRPQPGDRRLVPLRHLGITPPAVLQVVLPERVRQRLGIAA